MPTIGFAAQVLALVLSIYAVVMALSRRERRGVINLLNLARKNASIGRHRSAIQCSCPVVLQYLLDYRTLSNKICWPASPMTQRQHISLR